MKKLRIFFLATAVLTSVIFNTGCPYACANPQCTEVIDLGNPGSGPIPIPENPEIPAEFF